LLLTRRPLPTVWGTDRTNGELHKLMIRIHDMRFLHIGNSASTLAIAVPKGRMAISVVDGHELVHSAEITDQARFTFSSSGMSVIPITFSQRQARSNGKELLHALQTILSRPTSMDSRWRY